MRGLTAALVVLLLVVPGLSRADEQESTRAAAKIEFEAARSAFDAGRYPEALAAFERAYALAPFPDLLFDIGRCHERMGDRAAAISAYDRYLAVTPPSAEREDLVKHVATLRSELLGSTPVTATAPQAKRSRPIYRRWWLWTTIGLAVGAAVGIGVGVGLGTATPAASNTFPALQASP